MVIIEHKYCSVDVDVRRDSAVGRAVPHSLFYIHLLLAVDLLHRGPKVHHEVHRLRLLNDHSLSSLTRSPMSSLTSTDLLLVGGLI